MEQLAASHADWPLLDAEPLLEQIAPPESNKPSSSSTAPNSPLSPVLNTMARQDSVLFMGSPKSAPMASPPPLDNTVSAYSFTSQTSVMRVPPNTPNAASMGGSAVALYAPSLDIDLDVLARKAATFPGSTDPSSSHTRHFGDATFLMDAPAPLALPSIQRDAADDSIELDAPLVTPTPSSLTEIGDSDALPSFSLGVWTSTLTSTAGSDASTSSQSCGAEMLRAPTECISPLNLSHPTLVDVGLEKAEKNQTRRVSVHFADADTPRKNTAVSNSDGLPQTSLAQDIELDDLAQNSSDKPAMAAPVQPSPDAQPASSSASKPTSTPSTSTNQVAIPPPSTDNVPRIAPSVDNLHPALNGSLANIAAESAPSINAPGEPIKPEHIWFRDVRNHRIPGPSTDEEIQEALRQTLEAFNRLAPNRSKMLQRMWDLATIDPQILHRLMNEVFELHQADYERNRSRMPPPHPHMYPQSALRRNPEAEERHKEKKVFEEKRATIGRTWMNTRRNKKGTRATDGDQAEGKQLEEEGAQRVCRQKRRTSKGQEAAEPTTQPPHNTVTFGNISYAMDYRREVVTPAPTTRKWRNPDDDLDPDQIYEPLDPRDPRGREEWRPLPGVRVPRLEIEIRKKIFQFRVYLFREKKRKELGLTKQEMDEWEAKRGMGPIIEAKEKETIKLYGRPITEKDITYRSRRRGLHRIG
ncbi:hypothetical protein MKEN_00920700 [Mycena kentingensis (nom. inval.)]|nr:hypothetical protein MKEN_00920700 [Mycena kentingensis (nom. inval.)]